MTCEITVIVKDSEKTLRTKHLIYELVTCSEQDPVIAKCIQDTVRIFASEPTDISVKFHLEVL